MKKTVLIFLTVFVLVSCKDRDCEAFRLTHPVADWHLFPDREELYSFSKDSLTIKLTKDRENISGFEEIRCYYCSCNQLFSSTYKSNEDNFSSFVSYDSINEDYYQISYSINDQQATLFLTPSGSIKGKESDGTPYNDNLNYEILETLTLQGSTFSHVLHIEFINSDEISEIWVEKGAGLVGFEHDEEVYIRK